MSTVLVIEDSLDLQQLLKLALEGQGLTVALASNGKEALTCFPTLTPPPCLMLLDLMMPVMTGWDFLTEREKDPALLAVPVVICSAVDRGEIKAEVAAVMKKPVDLGTLIKTVRSYC